MAPLLAAGIQDMHAAWLKGGKVQRPWPDGCTTKIKVDFSSHEDGAVRPSPHGGHSR